MVITKQQVNSEHFGSARVFFEYKERKFIIHNGYDNDDFTSYVAIGEIGGDFQMSQYGTIMDFCQTKQGLTYKDWDMDLFKSKLAKYGFLGKLENLD